MLLLYLAAEREIDQAHFHGCDDHSDATKGPKALPEFLLSRCQRTEAPNAPAVTFGSEAPIIHGVGSPAADYGCK